MTDLVGKRFKRNKYGLSNWTDVVKKVWFVMACNVDGKTFKPLFMVRGRLHNYEVKDCVFLIENTTEGNFL